MEEQKLQNVSGNREGIFRFLVEGMKSVVSKQSHCIQLNWAVVRCWTQSSL
jgi:hypothetical protein